MAEAVGLDINIRFANLKEEFNKLSKEASKSVFSKPGQYQSGIAKGLSELPATILRTSEQNKQIVAALNKKFATILKGLFPDLSKEEIAEEAESLSKTGLKAIRKAQAQEIKDEQAYWAKVGNARYKWAQLTEEQKQAKLGERALKMPDFAETIRQANLRYEEHKRAEKDYEDLRQYYRPSEAEQEKLDKDFEYRKKLNNQESLDRTKKEALFRKQQAKDDKERQKRILMFLGKWNLYGISGRAITRTVSSAFNTVNQVSQEALSWRRLGELGIAGEGFGKATAQAQQAGLGKNTYAQFLKYLQAQKGALKIGEGNQALAWLFQLSPDTQTAEEMAQQIIDRLKDYPEDIALHLGKKAGLSEDFIAEARSGRLQEPAPFGGYSKEATETYAQLAESINKLTTAINVLAYNQGAGIIKAFIDTVKGNASGFFNPAAFVGNLAKQKIQANFKDIIVKITDTSGKERTLTGQSEINPEGQIDNENLTTMQQIITPDLSGYTAN